MEVGGCGEGEGRSEAASEGRTEVNKVGGREKKSEGRELEERQVGVARFYGAWR